VVRFDGWASVMSTTVSRWDLVLFISISADGAYRALSPAAARYPTHENTSSKKPVTFSFQNHSFLLAGY
jgi:hypothetical protein